MQQLIDQITDLMNKLEDYRQENVKLYLKALESDVGMVERIAAIRHTNPGIYEKIVNFDPSETCGCGAPAKNVILSANQEPVFSCNSVFRCPDRQSKTHAFYEKIEQEIHSMVVFLNFILLVVSKDNVSTDVLEMAKDIITTWPVNLKAHRAGMKVVAMLKTTNEDNQTLEPLKSSLSEKLKSLTVAANKTIESINSKAV